MVLVQESGKLLEASPQRTLFLSTLFTSSAWDGLWGGKALWNQLTLKFAYFTSQIYPALLLLHACTEWLEDTFRLWQYTRQIKPCTWIFGGPHGEQTASEKKSLRGQGNLIQHLYGLWTAKCLWTLLTERPSCFAEGGASEGRYSVNSSRRKQTIPSARCAESAGLSCVCTKLCVSS